MSRFIEHMNLDQITEAVRNPKAHDLETLGKSLERWGFADAPILDERTTRLVAGHGRLEVLRRWKDAGGLPPDGVEVDVSGQWLVPVQRGWSSKDDREAEAFLLAHNRLVEAGGWQTDMLTAVLKDMQVHFEPLGGLGSLPLGFSDDFLGQLLAEPPAAGQDPGAQEPPATPVSKAGELYELGPHRLACGDSRAEDVVSAIMGEGRARLVWTDPPYGVAIVGGSHAIPAEVRRARGKPTIRNDNLSPEETRDLFASALTRALCVPGAAVYATVPDGGLLPFMIAGMNASPFRFRHGLVWVKDRFVLGRTDYHYRHESVLYGWREDGPHYFCGDRTLDTVFEVARPSRSAEHPTMKPVELVARHVRASSQPGEIVYDPFGGSGTTLIAAALEGRVARLVELDPGYCDAIRMRWTKFAKSAGVDPGPGALEPKEPA